MDGGAWPVAANLKWAGSEEFLQQLQESLATGKCLYCHRDDENFTATVLHRDGNWILCQNSWPYKDREGGDAIGQFFMFKVVDDGEDHPQDLSDLTATDWMTITRLREWLGENCGVTGGGLGIRFGDPDHAGWTIGHLTVHIIQPRVGTVVDFPIG